MQVMYEEALNNQPAKLSRQLKQSSAFLLCYLPVVLLNRCLKVNVIIERIILSVLATHASMMLQEVKILVMQQAWLEEARINTIEDNLRKSFKHVNILMLSASLISIDA